jgi:hypothetical protein
MRIRAIVLTIGAVMMNVACVPPPREPINSVAYERRPPLPGQPGYLETIKFIFDGVHYISPTSGFLVSETGDLCFQGAIVPGNPPEYIPNNFWCISPFEVSRVEAIENDITYINQIRLWCRLGAPQCVYKTGYPNMLDDQWVANSITTETVPVLRQRDAIEYLVYLMGGDVERNQAMQ